MGGASEVKIFFMLAYSKARADRPVYVELIGDLRRRGFDVEAGVAESLVVDLANLRVDADLYILKSYSALWQQVAAVLDNRGARILNTFKATAATINKIQAAAALARADIPVPRAWVTGDLSLVNREIPLLIKPNTGHGGAGIRAVRHREDLGATQIDDGVLVQELVHPIDEETKLYVIGKRVFGIRKQERSGDRKPIAVDPALEDIALSCGSALGLEIYGVDIVVSRGEPFVLDVNHFPSFRGVPDVVSPLADYIASAAASS